MVDVMRFFFTKNKIYFALKKLFIIKFILLYNNF